MATDEAWGRTSSMQRMTTVWVAVVLMAVAVALAHWLTPRRILADELPPLNLATAVPEQFGGWRVDPAVVPVLPDPTVKEALDALYSATLNRTYIRTDGARVMLSVAYGKNQNSASTAAHRPEFCYTAQGFVVKRNGVDTVRVIDHDIKAVRLVATVGPRIEPITYWVTLGKSASIPGLTRKLDQMKFGLQGWIMDGMLMRVSSISPDQTVTSTEAAQALQDEFIHDLAQAMPAEQRSRFFGSNEN